MYTIFEAISFDFGNPRLTGKKATKNKITQLQ